MAVTRERVAAVAPVAAVARRRLRFGVPLGVCVLVAAMAQLPLIGNRGFFYADDSAMQFVPMWHYLGERLAAGHWPLLLDTSSWMGGNLAAEALFGTWNPVSLASYLLVARFDDLALAAAVVKTLYLVLLALGCYLLCREYGAPRWSASVLAVALPFGGFTLYYDASTWASGLIAFAWIPWVWLTVRRFARGRTLAVVPFLVTALALTAGNPYGLLAVCAVLLAVLVESVLLCRGGGMPWWPVLARLTVLALAIGGVALLVWAPVVGNLAVANRTAVVLHNEGHLVVSLNDLVGASSPAHLPRTSTFAATAVRASVPAAYLAWFLLPLLPWLRWGVLRARLRPRLGALAGPLVFAGCYLVASLGPSDFFMFRWPMRQLEYLFLGVAVVYAVALGAGLAADHVRRRTLLTGGLLLAAGYLSMASFPAYPSRYLISLGLIAVLVWLAVRASRRGSRPLVAVLQIGTVAVLALQLTLFPANPDVLAIAAPASVATMRAGLPDTAAGTTFQVANLTAWSDPRGTGSFLFGNLDRAAGSGAVTAYTGMGDRAFADALCLDFVGQTCPDAYRRLWQPTALSGAPVADLMRLQRVVVQRALLPEPAVPPGWAVAERTDSRVVLSRVDPLPWPNGRVSWASPNLRVADAAADGEQAERVHVERVGDGSASVAFARLAWPGYSAELDGRPVPVRAGPAGLLVADLPPDASSGELWVRWTPPGLWLGLGCAGLGLVLVAGLSAVAVRRQRAGMPAQPGHLTSAGLVGKPG